MTAPKMMLASGWAASLTSWAASSVCEQAEVGAAGDGDSTPRAPSMDASSSGEEIAISAAATARSSPRAEPMPISAEPASDMTDFRAK
ncbi:hypothetical protein SVIOM342S_06382 [Streptomyces violaceorubidus]